MDILARIIALALFVSAHAPGPPGASVEAHDAALRPLTVIGASVEQRSVLDEALATFDRAGLELPALVVRYEEDIGACQGHAGLFHIGTEGQPATIVVCHRLPLFLYHELGHAWADHVLTVDDRQRFLEHWDLERWDDRNDSWYHRGTEKAAHTIAYTLTLTEPTDDPNLLRFVCGYSVLTGMPRPNAALARCSGAGVAA